MAVENSADVLVKLLDKDPSERHSFQVNSFIPWLNNTSGVLRRLNQESLFKLVKYSQVERFSRNQLLYKQATNPDCCYIVLRGKVSVYEARTAGHFSNLARLLKKVPTDSKLVSTAIVRSKLRARSVSDSTRQRVKQRNRSASEADVALATKLDLKREFIEDAHRELIGFYIASVTTGALIGESSLLHGDERLASVLADTNDVCVMKVDPLLFHCVLKKTIQADYRRKSGFIDKYPLFQSCSRTDRTFIFAALDVRTYNYGEAVVRQGEEAVDLHFIVEGEVEILMNPQMHEARHKTEIREAKQLLKMIDEKLDFIRTLIAHNFRKQIRSTSKDEHWNAGSTSVNGKERDRHVVICTLQPVSVVGDIETVLNFTDYVQTAVCRRQTTVISIGRRHFERLSKRYPQASDKMLQHLKRVLWLRFEHNETLATDVPLLKYAQLKTYLLVQQQSYCDYQKEQRAAVPQNLRSSVEKYAKDEIKRDYESKAKISPFDRIDVVLPTEYIKERLGNLSTLAGLERKMKPIGKLVSHSHSHSLVHNKLPAIVRSSNSTNSYPTRPNYGQKE